MCHHLGRAGDHMEVLEAMAAQHPEDPTVSVNPLPNPQH